MSDELKLNAHLSFAGKCEEAFQFYEKCLGGKIAFMMAYEDSPMARQAPSGWGKKILHATFTLGDQVLTGADVPSDQYEEPQGFSVMLRLRDAAEAERIFNSLAEKGTVQVPIQERFWARFGMVVDRFGTPWLINAESRNDTQGGSV